MVKMVEGSSSLLGERHQQEHEDGGRLQRDLATGQRTALSARHLRVDVLVDDVVIGAAGGAHHDGADGEQQKQPGVWVVGADAARGERHRPETGNREQPEARGPVDPGKPQIGRKRRRREAIDDVRRACIGNRASFAFGHRTWHVFRSRHPVALTSMRDESTDARQVSAALRQVPARPRQRHRA